MKATLKFGFVSLFAIVMASCGTKQAALAPAVESSRTKTTSLEGDKVMSETFQDSGIEMVDALNDDGTGLVQVAYKWFADFGEADNKQVAVAIAQRNAYAKISRVLNNAVKDQAELGEVGNNGRVQQALTSHWKQVSVSIEKGCEPFGNVTIEYNPSTKMYKATAKVGIRGDLFKKMLDSAGSFKPSDLSGDELEQFIETNKSIMEAARGN